MLRRHEHRLIAMARHTRLDLGGSEAMGLVTAGAARVAGRERAIVDAQLARLLRVAASAALIGDEIDLVHAVAVETAAGAGVTRVLVGMTGGAWFRIERRRRVRAVAVAARLIGVRADRVVPALRALVTAHAGRCRAGPEAMAVLTARLVRSLMQGRHHVRVAALAQLCGRLREAALAVALRALDLADVRDVARAGGDVTIRGRDLLRRTMLARARARDEQRDQDDPDHGRDPIGWHDRHGIAETGKRLDQPAGCGLPPTPPTA
jgi:hypothetical protein